MFKKLFKDEKVSELDSLIDEAVSHLEIIGPTHEDYPNILSNLERLYKLRDRKKPTFVNSDTLLTVIGNFAGILLIVAYEQKHVITSKALGQVIRLK